jgi:hypothetical protein
MDESAIATLLGEICKEMSKTAVQSMFNVRGSRCRDGRYSDHETKGPTGETTGGTKHMPARETSTVNWRQARVSAQSAKHGMDSDEEDYGSKIGLTAEDLVKLDEEVGRAVRLRTEAIKAAAGKRLLLADKSPDGLPHEMPFLTAEEYETLHGSWPSASDLDKTFVLIKDGRGNYLSKEAFYRTIEVGPTLSKAARLHARDWKFAKEMDALGLSSIHFGASRPAIGGERIQQTVAGKREREQVFEYPLQSGADAPDVLVMDGDGKHIGIYPKLDPGMKGSPLKSATKKFGPGNVWLKTPENSYKTVEAMNERTPDIAEQAFANFKRDPLPKMLVSARDGIFVSKARHDEMQKDRNRLRPQQIDSIHNEMLFLNERTKAYVSLQALRQLYVNNPEDLEKVMLEADLSTSLTRGQPRPGPAVLVRCGRDVFFPAERFRSAASKSPLNVERSDHDIYVQNVDRRGNYTGSYTSLAQLERAGRKPNGEQLGQLGLLNSVVLRTQLITED